MLPEEGVSSLPVCSALVPASVSFRDPLLMLLPRTSSANFAADFFFLDFSSSEDREEEDMMVSNVPYAIDFGRLPPRGREGPLSDAIACSVGPLT